MQRPRRREAKEKCVKLVIDVIEKEISHKFNSKKQLSKLGIHKQPNNKYHKMLFKIFEYLEECKGNYKNNMRHLIRDYLISVYEYYQRFNRIPNLIQIGPSASNQIRFEEWIYDAMRNSDENYWVDEIYEFEIVEVPIEPMDVDLNFTET